MVRRARHRSLPLSPVPVAACPLRTQERTWAGFSGRVSSSNDRAECGRRSKQSEGATRCCAFSRPSIPRGNSEAHHRQLQRKSAQFRFVRSTRRRVLKRRRKSQAHKGVHKMHLVENKRFNQSAQERTESAQCAPANSAQRTAPYKGLCARAPRARFGPMHDRTHGTLGPNRHTSRRRQIDIPIGSCRPGIEILQVCRTTGGPR